MQKTELSVFLHQLQASQKIPQAKNVLAQIVIEKLHNWCMQLFWITVLCVINCCGEENEEKKVQPKTQEQPKKRISDIEQKVLRHLTSPMMTGPLRPVRRITKRRISSRPPSPQLFDIDEEE